jgi:hypothetical protein
MKYIWKYKLKVDSVVAVKIPKGSIILSVNAQYNEIVVYVLVQDLEFNSETTTVTFRIIGTGHAIDDDIDIDYHFLGTVSLDDGLFMFHIFMEKSEFVEVYK